MTAIIWGDLVKSQVDNETIEEAIARIAQQHDDDANAHLDTGQSLSSHKAAAIIDHVATSIITDKLASGAVTAPKMATAGKVADCVVAASGGDYTTIGAALTAGKKIIFIKKGTYTLSADIVLSSGVVLKGEDKFATIIDFNEGAYGIKIQGTSGNNVVNVIVEDLTIKNSSDVAVFGKFVDEITIRECIFEDNVHNIDFTAGEEEYIGHFEIIGNRFLNDGDIIFSYYDTELERPLRISHNLFYNCDPSVIDIDYTGEEVFSFIHHNLIYWSTQQTSGVAIATAHCNISDNTIYSAFVAIKCSIAFVSRNYINNSRDIAIHLYGGWCQVVGNRIIKVDNGSNQIGIYLEAGGKNTIIGNFVYDCTTTCIYVEETDYNSINSNHCRSSALGIGIDSGGNYNVVIGNVTTDCTNEIVDDGTGNDVAHNTHD